ncbi:XdhC family protein [Robbsia sp. Bb-Pol-6]|uniref:XdhC family protein n=1 Tax=Robbsia betulipollinis TaxID=2981849 RepID=A0ABT3ZLT2_9BURK|nr:XdhC family protein [Robbsia betulipollinis]MCY0387516.1 XdhC family protein [Robbsia betulipollinis]
MDNIDLEVLHSAADWQREGFRTVLGTVVRTWGSAPRPVGSIVAIRADGRIAGSVSGGCIEDDLIARARAGALPAERPEQLTYGVSAEEAQRFGLPCGGTLQLVLEPLGERSALPALLDAIATDRLIVRRLDLRTGAASLAPVPPGNGTGFSFDGETLAVVHGAPYRLLLIGAGQLSRYVAEMAVPLGYEVTVCDPREEYVGGWHVAHTTLVTDMPDDVVLSMGVDSRTAIVALTHDPKLDDLALIDALQSPAFYVGAIGSRANRVARAARLKLFDVDDAQLARLHSPVGLAIGAKTPPEIAVSILAEMTAVRYKVVHAGSSLDRATHGQLAGRATASATDRA